MFRLRAIQRVVGPLCEYRAVAVKIVAPVIRRMRPQISSKDGHWDEYDYGEADYFLTKADRGAYSSARDFMRFKRALYGGRVVADSMLVAMNKPYIATDIPIC